MTPLPGRLQVHVVYLLAAWLVAGLPAAYAQSPAEPPGAAAAGPITVGADVSATFGSKDPGFFNYATYAYDPLRNVRGVFDVAVRVSPRLEALGQLRTDDASHARVTALYLRIRPWQRRQFDVQVGRVPTTFGLFGRSGYGGDNPLIGRPLAYGYLTSLRRDALPASARDLLGMRGRGWLVTFPVGNTTPQRGLPIVDPDSWDTGLQARLVRGRVEWVAAVTQGSLGSPRVRDDNHGRALASRLVARPTAALTLGTSVSRGAFLADTLRAELGTTRSVESFRQTAAGLDAQWASGRWQLRGELIRSTWEMPSSQDAALGGGLSSIASWLEGRLRVLPGVDVAARAETLRFSDVSSASGPQPWESPVTRIEAGLAIAPQRHIRVKFAAQRNRRPLGGRVRHDTLLATQVGVWF